MRDPRGRPATASLSYTTNRLARALNRAAENSALAHGTTLPQLFILKVLGEGIPLSNADVARRTFVSSQAAHIVVSELVETGIIERVDDPSNRRVRLLRLTDAGWRLLADCEIEIVEREKRLIDAVDMKADDSLIDALIQAAEHLAGGYFGDKDAEAAAVAARRRRPRGRISPT